MAVPILLCFWRQGVAVRLAVLPLQPCCTPSATPIPPRGGSQDGWPRRRQGLPRSRLREDAALCMAREVARGAAMLKATTAEPHHATPRRKLLQPARLRPSRRGSVSGLRPCTLLARATGPARPILSEPARRTASGRRQPASEHHNGDARRSLGKCRRAHPAGGDGACCMAASRRRSSTRRTTRTAPRGHAGDGAFHPPLRLARTAAPAHDAEPRAGRGDARLRGLRCAAAGSQLDLGDHGSGRAVGVVRPRRGRGALASRPLLVARRHVELLGPLLGLHAQWAWACIAAGATRRVERAAELRRCSPRSAPP